MDVKAGLGLYWSQNLSVIFPSTEEVNKPIKQVSVCEIQTANVSTTCLDGLILYFKLKINEE